MKPFGETIREMRMAQEMGLRRAAERLGISPAYLSRVERGKERPPRPDLVKADSDAPGRGPRHAVQARREHRPRPRRVHPPDAERSRVPAGCQGSGSHRGRLYRANRADQTMPSLGDRNYWEGVALARSSQHTDGRPACRRCSSTAYASPGGQRWPCWQTLPPSSVWTALRHHQLRLVLTVAEGHRRLPHDTRAVAAPRGRPLAEPRKGP